MATTYAQQSQSVVPKSHVGFDSITSQIEKKLLKRGFQFNVICVGMENREASMVWEVANSLQDKLASESRP